MEIEKIPVKIGRTVIGDATISEDGQISMELKKSELTAEMFRFFAFGMYSGFSLKPEVIPVVPEN